MRADVQIHTYTFTDEVTTLQNGNCNPDLLLEVEKRMKYSYNYQTWVSRYVNTCSHTNTPLHLFFLGRKKFFFFNHSIKLLGKQPPESKWKCEEILLIFSPLPGFPSSPHWPMKEAMPVLTAGAGKTSADAQHILSILLKASCAPSVHANIHDGFSNSCPVQGYMKRWPCWPLSCGQMPITKRTWCSSKMSSVRGVWDTWWRWGIMILVRMVQALQMITCNIIIWITNF